MSDDREAIEATIEAIVAQHDGRSVVLKFVTSEGLLAFALPEQDLPALMAMTSRLAADLRQRQGNEAAIVQAFKTEWWDIDSEQERGDLVFAFRLVGGGIRLNFIADRKVGPPMIEAIEKTMGKTFAAPPGQLPQ